VSAVALIVAGRAVQTVPAERRTTPPAGQILANRVNHHLVGEGGGAAATVPVAALALALALALDPSAVEVEVKLESVVVLHGGITGAGKGGRGNSAGTKLVRR
jgi:hypothetical protein